MKPIFSVQVESKQRLNQFTRGIISYQFLSVLSISIAFLFVCPLRRGMCERAESAASQLGREGKTPTVHCSSPTHVHLAFDRGVLSPFCRIWISFVLYKRQCIAMQFEEELFSHHPSLSRTFERPPIAASSSGVPTPIREGAVAPKVRSPNMV